MMEPARVVPRRIWHEGSPSVGSRSIPEEAAVAVTYNGGTYAVMMTTPQDLEDFAVGFSLSEGVITSSADIDSLDVLPLDGGVELRMWLIKPQADRLRERRRHIAGPTGCGLCGIESIAEALRPAAIVGPGPQFSPEQIMVAMRSLPSRQKLNIETRAIHAAALWNPAGGIVALREDVGRHNALDKLSGALARASVVAGEGIILLTSRISVEMVQKSAAIGVPVMVSVSAPTALAVRMADAASITLAAIARADGFEVFTHPSRISHGRAPEPLYSTDGSENLTETTMRKAILVVISVSLVAVSTVQVAAKAGSYLQMNPARAPASQQFRNANSAWLFVEQQNRSDHRECRVISAPADH